MLTFVSTLNCLPKKWTKHGWAAIDDQHGKIPSLDLCSSCVEQRKGGNSKHNIYKSRNSVCTEKFGSTSAACICL